VLLQIIFEVGTYSLYCLGSIDSIGSIGTIGSTSCKHVL